MTDPQTVRVGVRPRDIGEDRLRYLRQLGVTDVFVNHADTEEEPDEFNDRIASDTVAVGPGTIPSVEEIVAARERIEDAGLRLTGIHSLPYSLYGDIMFEREGKEEALEDIATLIRNLGDAGVPVLGYQWNPAGWCLCGPNRSKYVAAPRRRPSTSKSWQTRTS